MRAAASGDGVHVRVVALGQVPVGHGHELPIGPRADHEDVVEGAGHHAVTIANRGPLVSHQRGRASTPIVTVAP